MTDERSQGSGRSEGESFQALAAETDRMVFVWATDVRMLWTNEVFVRETGLTPSDFGFDNRENPFIPPGRPAAGTGRAGGVCGLGRSEVTGDPEPLRRRVGTDAGDRHGRSQSGLAGRAGPEC
jgi:hypothetical protein